MSSHTYVKDEECGHQGYISAKGCVVCAQAALVRISDAARALLDSDISLCDHVTDSREWDRQMDLLHALREALSPPSPTSAEGRCPINDDGKHRDRGGPFMASCDCGWSAEP